MARAPHPHGSIWLRFFFSTPKRFVWTLGIIAAAIAVARPDLAQLALMNVLGAVLGAITPYLHQILTLIIALFGIAVLLGRFRPKKKKKEDH